MLKPTDEITFFRNLLGGLLAHYDHYGSGERTGRYVEEMIQMLETRAKNDSRISRGFALGLREAYNIK